MVMVIVCVYDDNCVYDADNYPLWIDPGRLTLLEGYGDGDCMCDDDPGRGGYVW